MPVRALAVLAGGALLSGGLLVAPSAASASTLRADDPPTTYTTTDAAVAIPDGMDYQGTSPGAAVSQQVVVSGATGVVSHLEVGVTISHTWSQDVTLTVTAPDGTSATLASNSGANGNDLSGRYTFTDTATQTWQDVTAVDGVVPVGAYRAFNRSRTTGETDLISLDDAFDGKDPNGTWTITAQDFYLEDTGTLTSSDLTVGTKPADTTGPTVVISSGPDDGATVDQAPSYGFSSADADLASYQCAVDGGTYSACTSPATAQVTDPGAHSFSVRGVDTTGNTGAAVTRTFTLRDVACDDATAALEAAQADLVTAKQKVDKAKVRLAKARKSGNPTRIAKAKKKLAAAKADLGDAKDAVDDAQAQVDQDC